MKKEYKTYCLTLQTLRERDRERRRWSVFYYYFLPTMNWQGPAQTHLKSPSSNTRERERESTRDLLSLSLNSVWSVSTDKILHCHIQPHTPVIFSRKLSFVASARPDESSSSKLLVNNNKIIAPNYTRVTPINCAV